MAKDVRGKFLAEQGRAGLGGCRAVLGEEAFDGISAERPAPAGGEERLGRLALSDRKLSLFADSAQPPAAEWPGGLSVRCGYYGEWRDTSEGGRDGVVTDGCAGQAAVPASGTAA